MGGSCHAACESALTDAIGADHFHGTVTTAVDACTPATGTRIA